MSHNNRRPAVPGRVVAQLVAVTTTRLSNQHPAIDGAVVHAVVLQAAAELTGADPAPERLRHMLQRRAGARLLALTGAPVPIARARPGLA